MIMRMCCGIRVSRRKQLNGQVGSSLGVERGRGLLHLFGFDTNKIYRSSGFVGNFQRPLLTGPKPAVHVLEKLTSSYGCLAPSCFLVWELFTHIIYDAQVQV